MKVKANKSPAIPLEHWEKHYDVEIKKDKHGLMGSEFDPKNNQKRMVTYNKINEQDH